MAGQTRLELATYGVTGRHSNQTELLPLYFDSNKIYFYFAGVNEKDSLKNQDPRKR
jgi:hypothetical protein